MSYIVQITPQAQQKMQEIYQYIAEELLSPEYAIKQYDRIAEAILSLKDFPARYPLVRFEPERSQGLHQLPVDNYMVFYTIREQRVIVISVLYSASDLAVRLSRQQF